MQVCLVLPALGPYQTHVLVGPEAGLTAWAGGKNV